MVALGSFIIFVFGFGADRLAGWGCHFTHFEGWELGGALWSFLFAFYYLYRYSFTGQQNVDKVVLIIVFCIFVSTVVAVVVIIYLHNYILHVAIMSTIVYVFLIADFLVARYHTDEPQRKAFAESFWVADVPVILGFLVLLAYALSHPRCAEDLPVFFSGAISFQLLVSHSIFVLTQAGYLRKIWEAK